MGELNVLILYELNVLFLYELNVLILTLDTLWDHLPRLKHFKRLQTFTRRRRCSPVKKLRAFRVLDAFEHCASLPNADAIRVLEFALVDVAHAASADATSSLAPCEHRALHEWVSPLMHQNRCSIQHCLYYNKHAKTFHMFRTRYSDQCVKPLLLSSEPNLSRGPPLTNNSNHNPNHNSNSNHNSNHNPIHTIKDNSNNG